MKRVSTPERAFYAVCLLAFSAALGTPACAQSAGKAHTNCIGMAFVLIPAGTFAMGAADNDRDATASEKPQHQVTISKPFYLGKYEVTQAEWQAVMGSSPYNGARSNPFFDLPGMAARVVKPTNPVTMSWNEAQEFIQRLNRAEGHQRYRLPTEAEWEYAARAGTTTAYSFGDDARLLARHAWFGEDFATGAPHAVGQKAPNAWGLHDVHGNVWEWVQDRYADLYDAAPVTDPKGPPKGSSRVVRGGSWHVTSTSWRSSFRKPYDSDYRGISIGFRLALSLDP